MMMMMKMMVMVVVVMVVDAGDGDDPAAAAGDGVNDNYDDGSMITMHPVVTVAVKAIDRFLTK